MEGPLPSSPKHRFVPADDRDLECAEERAAGHPAVAALAQVVDDLVDVIVAANLPTFVRRATAAALCAAAAAHALAEATTEGSLDS